LRAAGIIKKKRLDRIDHREEKFDPNGNYHLFIRTGF
jgi:hypothetical protein